MEREIVIASLALVVACLTAYLTMRHNRLSVRPLLHISRSFSGNKFRIYLRNSGTGPGTIESVDVVLADATLDGTVTSWTGQLHDQCAALLRREKIRPPAVGTGGSLVASTLERGGVLAPSEDFVLVRTDEKFNNPKAARAIYAYLLDHLAFIITYTSIYGERFSYHEPRRV